MTVFVLSLTSQDLRITLELGVYQIDCYQVFKFGPLCLMLKHIYILAIYFARYYLYLKIALLALFFRMSIHYHQSWMRSSTAITQTN